MKKKLLVLLLIVTLALFVFAGCDFLPPNGAEGEGEGEGEEEVKPVVVLVEAFFVDGCGNCRVVEPLLEELAKEYGKDKMILVEEAPWGLYSTSEVGDRYDWYIPGGTGVPIILFNGLASKIEGVTNKNAIKAQIDNQLSINPAIQLQASRATDSERTVITGKVKNNGESALTNLVVNGMVFKDRGRQGFRYSVTDIFEDEKVSISSLAAGEEVSFTITIDGLNWDAENLDGVIFVQSVDHPKKVIRQSLFLD